MTEQKTKELSDKVEFQEPTPENVQIGDFLVGDNGDEFDYRYSLNDRAKCSAKIIGVSKTSVIIRPILEDPILKRDGTYLVGKYIHKFTEESERT